MNQRAPATRFRDFYGTRPFLSALWENHPDTDLLPATRLYSRANRQSAFPVSVAIRKLSLYRRIIERKGERVGTRGE